MSPAISITISSIGCCEARSLIAVVRHARARRVSLKVDPATGAVRLVVPPRAPLKPALAWAGEEQAWIERQRAQLPTPRPFVDGATLPFEDGALTISWEAAGARTVERDGDRLHVGGPPQGVARRVEAWLRGEALARLRADTDHYAARAKVGVERVSVGDPRGRWGSCAATGVIRYSWRLVCAPVAVRRATAAHEVAHRVHMNHGPRFHALVAELYEDDPTPARHWLRAHGAGLHWLGRAPDD